MGKVYSQRLPALLKGMAALSPRQFRVGLHRLSVSIVILSILSGASLSFSFEATRHLGLFLISAFKQNSAPASKANYSKKDAP